MAKDEIQPFQGGQERIQQYNTPGYASAYANYALNPTILGSLGAEAMQSASLAIAQQWGTQAGQNPRGDILPPITNFDKAYAASYSSQAASTLSLQAQQLFYKSQEQLSQSPSLTPELVRSYQENVARGLEDILSVAPSNIRPELEAQFANELIKDVHSLNLDMTKQQRLRGVNNSQKYIDTISNQINDAFMAGNEQEATDLYMGALKFNAASESGAILTPEQREALDKQAKISYFTSKYSAMAFQARQEGKLEQYISELIDHRPDGVDADEWDIIRSQTVKYVDGIEALDRRRQGLALSEATLLASTGNITPAYLADLETRLSPTSYNYFVAQYLSQNSAKVQKQQQVQELAANWGNAQVLGQSTESEINEAFNAQVQFAQQVAQQRGEILTEEDAKLRIALTAGVPVPAYLKELSTKLQSGNPQLMLDGLLAYTQLTASNGFLASGVKENAVAMGYLFQNYRRQGVDPTIAADRAKQVIFNKTPEMQEQAAMAVQEWRDRHASNIKNLNAWAKRTAGVKDKNFIGNISNFSTNLKSMMEANIKLTGDVDAAQEMTEQAVRQYWGTTRVNGQDEFTYLPIEKIIRLPNGAESFIQKDAVRQLKDQLVVNDEAYMKGFVDFTYKIEEDEKGKKPPQVIREYRDGSKEKFQLYIKSSPLIDIGSGVNSTIGGYDLLLLNENNVFIPITGAYLGGIQNAIYQPDLEYINSLIVGSSLDPRKQFENYIQDIKRTKTH